MQLSSSTLVYSQWWSVYQWASGCKHNCFNEYKIIEWVYVNAKKSARSSQPLSLSHCLLRHNWIDRIVDGTRYCEHHGSLFINRVRWNIHLCIQWLPHIYVSWFWWFKDVRSVGTQPGIYVSIEIWILRRGKRLLIRRGNRNCQGRHPAEQSYSSIRNLFSFSKKRFDWNASYIDYTFKSTCPGGFLYESYYLHNLKKSSSSIPANIFFFRFSYWHICQAECK